MDDEYREIVAREKQRREAEEEARLKQIREWQTIMILFALRKHQVPVEEVFTDRYLFDFPYHGMRVYLQNYITRLWGKVHRLPQDDAEEYMIRKYRPLMLSQGKKVPDGFRKYFQYHQFMYAGKPELLVPKVLNAVVLIKTHPFLW